MHPTPAIFFPCVFAHKIGFDQDGLSFTSFEKGFGPTVQRRPWNLDKDPTISCAKQHIKNENENEMGTFPAVGLMAGVPGAKFL